MCTLLVRHYDSDARQLAAQSDLESTNIETFMRLNNFSNLRTGLEQLVEKIEGITPQCPPAFRSQEHKLRFLRNAVKFQPWAKQAIAQMTTARYGFNSFVTALYECLTLAVETKDHSGSIQLGPSTAPTTAPTYYQQYGRPPPSMKRPGLKVPQGRVPYDTRARRTHLGEMESQ